MDITKATLTALALTATLALVSCSEDSAQTPTGEATTTDDPHAGHAHAAGESHDDHDHSHGEEVPLGTFDMAGMTVEAAQGHGNIEPGKELHLVVKLPYSDNGASVLRAWIGTDDRLASMVAKGDYASSHDDYDVHAIAPDPLPDNTMWWVEVTKPDGTKALGSIAPK